MTHYRSSNYDSLGDFQFRTDMHVDNIIRMNNNNIMLINVNHGDGYTDGLYIGTRYAVKLCMIHLDIVGETYENTIKRNIERHNLL